MQEYISVIQRRKWVIISFFFITVVSVTIATFMQKKIYRATATVIVDVTSPQVLSVKDVVKLGESNYFAYRDYLETQQEIIRSRRTAYNVIKNLNLTARKEFKESKDPIETLLKKLRVELVRDTRILKIHIDDRDPRLASIIANEFARVYADSNMALKIKMSTQAEEWLKREVAKQKRKVRESEVALQRYKEQNNIVSIDSQREIVNDALTKLNASYLDARKHRIKMETLYKSVIGEDGSVKFEGLPALSIENRTLQQLKEDYLKKQALFSEYKMIYKNKHPRMRRLLESIDYIKSSIKNEVESGYQTAVAEEDRFRTALEEQKRKALRLDRMIINYNALNREVETNKRILQILLNRLKETSISGQIQMNNVRVQDLAEIPRRPVRPRKKLNIALSIIVGLLGGIGLAFLREYTDTTLKNADEIAGAVQVPILGAVPRVKPDGKIIKDQSDIDRVVEKDSHSLVSEAYRTIRTNLLFSIPDASSAKSIVVTSSIPREGKTICAVNLAIMIANSGEKVLLVDADMRKPRVHQIFNKDNRPGLLQFLSGEVDFGSILKDSDVDNLSLVTSGGATHKPAELISSENMRDFLEKSAADFSKIIFDSPPITLVTDAQILSSMCTGVILIAERGRITRNLLNKSKELLQKVHANILGLIVNNISLTKDIYSYPQYYYGKYYTLARD